MPNVLTTCPYCGCGCGLYLVSDCEKLSGSFPSRNHPVSRGALCVKGWNAHEFVNNPDRLTKPLIKHNGALKEASWDEALGLVSERLIEHRERYGPDSLAFLSSAKLSNEENYLMMKLARAVFGTNNVDHCARLCHASTVTGLASAFGSGAMTNSISEFEDADLFLVTGSDTTGQHPLIGSRIVNAVRDGKAGLIVVDPRRIELAKYATIYAHMRNGTDVAWINGVINVIVSENLADNEFIGKRTENYDALVRLVAGYTPEIVEEITTIPASVIRDIARLYAKTRKAMIVYSMGITQHTTGVDNVRSIANLAMITGHVGYASSGVNPLRGQNNVQGSCDLGALPDLYSGYQKVTDEAARKKFEDAWQVKSLPANPGLTVTEIINAAGIGRVKGLYIMGENVVMSDPDSLHVIESLRNTDFLVVQDIFMTETAEHADVVLPAASFAEKDGTFTNTERRIERIRKAVNPPGEALADWRILCEIARRAGYDKMTYAHPSEIMDEAALLTPIYGGISYERLEPFGIQWPCPSKDHPGTPILHREKFSKGTGTFFPVEYRPPAEETDEEYRFILSTGRIYWHYHTGTMTRRTSTLEREAPAAFVEINPQDAKDLAIRDGGMVRVSTRRGAITLAARVTAIVAKGSLFIPFHYKEAAANVLTNPSVDPVAKIPEYKVCAARLEKI